jgi:hypothetical protein
MKKSSKSFLWTQLTYISWAQFEAKDEMKNALILHLQKKETETPDKTEHDDPGNEVPAEAEAGAAAAEIGAALEEDPDPAEGEEEEEATADPDVD